MIEQVLHSVINAKYARSTSWTVAFWNYRESITTNEQNKLIYIRGYFTSMRMLHETCYSQLRNQHVRYWQMLTWKPITTICPYCTASTLHGALHCTSRISERQLWNSNLLLGYEAQNIRRVVCFLYQYQLFALPTTMKMSVCLCQ